MTIGDFGEPRIERAPQQDICSFGEHCAPETASDDRICDFGEACGNGTPETQICAFGEPCDDAPGLRFGAINTFGGADPDFSPAANICDFGEACAPA